MTSMKFEHEKISPTAKLVAYWRQFSDIPFSKDVATLFNTESVVLDMFKNIGMDSPQVEIMAPLLESRYKSIGNFIKKSPIKQVLEFASGISLRGLAMTADPAITYIETDLPGLMQEKIKLIETLKDRNNIKDRNNLFFYNANILNANEIETTLQHFNDRKPVVMVHEGLFQYLSKAEKAAAAKNIHSVLKRFGGLWITPDLDTKAQRKLLDFDAKHFQKFSDIIEKTTGRNFDQNSFDDDNDVFNFFHDLGFDVKWQPQIDDDMVLSSLANKPFSAKTNDILQSLRLWVLSART